MTPFFNGETLKLILLLALFAFPCLGTTPNLASIFEQVSIEYKVSYELLSKIAAIESNFKQRATTKTSSAKGLFQVIRSTELWLREMCDIEGDVFDPTTNTRLGACLIQYNTKYFTRKVKRPPTHTESYILHFFGGYTGVRFVRYVKSKGSRIAYKHFQRESKANPRIFFKRSGKARTIREIMILFKLKIRQAKVLELESK